MSDTHRPAWLSQLRERGVIRVAVSYAVIAWLLLQIADVTFEPLGLPKWAMPALIVTAALGFPVAVLLAWFLELGDHGLTRDSASPEAARPRVHGLRRYADVAVIGVLLATVAVLLVKQSDLGRPPPPEKPSVAVLPFDNLSGDPEQQYFSDGLAEEVLDRLGQVPGLLVVSRSSSFSFRDKHLDVRTIAERLGVAAVLEGAVRRDGKRLKLSAKLVDGKTGYQLWSGSFDREVNDVFAVQAELAQAVIEAIVPLARGDDADAIAAATSATPPTTSLSAYDLYLLGRAAQTMRGPVPGNYLQRSVDYFDHALAADPKFARAQAALANSLVLLVGYSEDSPQHEASVRRAEAAVYKALALDPESSDAQLAYANLLRGTVRAGAEEAYRRALELDPNNSEGWHGYAVFLSNLPDRREESDTATRRALELDPRSAVTWANYLGGLSRSDERRYREEVDRAIRTFADVPDVLFSFAGESAFAGRPVVGMKFIAAGRASSRASSIEPDSAGYSPGFVWRNVDEERVARETDAEIRTNPDLLRKGIAFLLIDSTGMTGNEQRLREIFAELAEVRGADDRQLNLRMAFWYSVFGHYDEAAKALALAEPVREFDGGGLGASIVTFQALPAMLRVYRATGRSAEADALAQRYLTKWRAERPAKPEGWDQTQWTDLAALAANEGHRDEAVEALRQAMNLTDLPFLFRPTLPWFRSLEGHPGYDALVRERAGRIAKFKTEMLAIEAGEARASSGSQERTR